VHELSLAEEMVRIIRKTVGGSGELRTVTVVMGPLSGVSPESLSFCFTEVARMKGMGSPGLVVRETDAAFRCLSCGFRWRGRNFTPGCPACGSWEREIESGREFYIESVELNGENEDEGEHPGHGQEQGACRTEPPDI
jgi:hydrogenase nickel incorporation protein HypA/HybF